MCIFGETKRYNMSKFTKLSVVEVYTNSSKTKKVEIVKFQKTGTNRIFFTPEVGGLRLVKTMFARKYEAVRVSKQYLARVS